MSKKYFGNYLITRKDCPHCKELEQEIQERGTVEKFTIIDAESLDGKTLAAYSETLGNTVPYLICLYANQKFGRGHDVFGRDENGKIEEQRITEVRGALWGAE